jgi:predicted ATPase
LKIKKLSIKNFKSLIDIEINEPNPFTVFVGPNGSGKSNIFEAIQLAAIPYRFGSFPQSHYQWISVFGGYESIKPKVQHVGNLLIQLFNDTDNRYEINYNFINEEPLDVLSDVVFADIMNRLPTRDISAILKNCRRLFINNKEIIKIPESASSFLDSSASNMVNVLKRILEEGPLKVEITEWLQIFIPELHKVEVQLNNLNGNGELAVFEKNISNPLPANLISDGTKNILSLLTAVYQSNEPQFLCIEEPENGLHPYVIKELVSFFRQQCEDKGHYIWLNTHSQTLVNQLEAKEIIVVNKKEGKTILKQFKDSNFHGLTMDEAWLSNAMRGGVPW